jgi:predicted RNase H-like HicB family nuclease
MSYHYSMVIQWSEEDQLFLVHLPEFSWQQFHTHGRTYEEAAKNGQEVIEAFVEMLKEEDKPLPEPRILPTKPLQVALLRVVIASTQPTVMSDREVLLSSPTLKCDRCIWR